MPQELLQGATWPGVESVASCQYVCSHGISPGRAVLTTYPQLASPAEFGNLTFYDGSRTVTIRGCKVESVSPQWSPGGIVYTLDILDERWQWVGYGGLDGHYNAKDDHGKLIPWTIRSPSELAGLCYAALGIQRGTVVLPPGLSRAAGADVENYLRLGQNFRQTTTNPEMIWDHTPPAEALAQLADTYGCRVIYRPNSSRVDVVPLGQGQPFPNLPYESIGATVSAVPAPVAVGAYGPPVEIQARFLLQAVGEEWDGSRVPINQLSYSPVGKDLPQVARVENSTVYVLGILTPIPSGTLPLMVFVTFKDVTGAEQNVSGISSTGGSNAAKFAAVAAKLNADPTFATAIFASADATGITLTGKIPGAFSLRVLDPSTGFASAWAFGKVTQVGREAKASWNTTNPRLFREVQPTGRLSYEEARGLALRSVYREYRILNRDPHDMFNLDKPGRPIDLPWWGKVKRRQQILLLDKKVEEVIPAPRIPGAVNKQVPAGAFNVPGQGVLPEFYNGYSRAQKPVVYGSVAALIGNVNWMFMVNAPRPNRFNPIEDIAEAKLNTDPASRVFVDFTINQKEQLITFSEPVFYWEGGASGALQREPFLTLECAVNVLNPETNAPARWHELLSISGGVAPVEWRYREDLEVGIIGRYGDNNKLTGFDYAYLADAKARAGYYLRAQAARYQIKGGETRQYIGIIAHDPDGYCQQAVWSVGEGGPTTVLAGNTEWHPATAPYPARRRNENLPPDKSAALANMKEREFLRQITPFEVKKDS